MGIGFNVEDYVNENTIKFGIGELEAVNSLTVQKQLVHIEEFLQEFCMQQKKLSEQVKRYSKLSILSVSVGAGVPRSQINLNINTLKLYLENRIMEIEKKDIFNIKKHERLKSEKRELEAYLDGLRLQIVDFFELKLRHEMLESENKRLILQNESRQKDVQKLEGENSELRKALSEFNKKKIIPLN